MAALFLFSGEGFMHQRHAQGHAGTPSGHGAYGKTIGFSKKEFQTAMGIAQADGRVVAVGACDIILQIGPAPPGQCRPPLSLTEKNRSPSS